MPRAALVGLLLLVVSASPRGTCAQDLVGRFREGRVRRIAREQAERHGMRLKVLPPDALGVPSDTIRAWLQSFLDPEITDPPAPVVQPIVVDSLRVIRKLERPAFEERFDSVRWAFLQGRTFSVLDTTQTRDLRARMEAHFGPPTRTLAEVDSVEMQPREEVIQFEYWMIVNDSIPVVIVDVNGFVDRGVVFASDARYRNRLGELREAVLRPILDPLTRERYVDFYFHVESRTWFASGFDGASFFTRRIVRPDLTRGRPFIGTYASDPRER